MRSWWVFSFLLGCAIEDTWVLQRTPAEVSHDAGADDEGTGDAGPGDAGRRSLSDALVGHYPFDDADGGRRATDVSGAQRHGALVGAAFLDPDGGRLRGALQVSDGGALLPSGALSGPTVDSYAFSLWFRVDARPLTTDVTEGARLVTLYRGGGDRLAAGVLLPGDGSDSVWFLFDEVGPGAMGRVVFPDAGLSPDRWHHAAFSWDADAGLARVAFDGRRWEATRFVTSVTGAAVPLGFANFAPRAPGQFVGALDEVRFWRRPLTTEDLDVLWTTP